MIFDDQSPRCVHRAQFLRRRSLSMGLDTPFSMKFRIIGTWSSSVKLLPGLTVSSSPQEMETFVEDTL